MEKGLKIKTNNLIALSYMVDEFNFFCSDFKELVSGTKSVKRIAETLSKLHSNATVLADKNVKEFYKKYQTPITNVNNHVLINDFVMDMFDEKGEISKGTKELHNYLLMHRSCLYMILDVLYRINKLEIANIVLNEDFKFNRKLYKINKIFPKNDVISYVDNIKPMPGYSEEVVSYRSLGSNYEIKLIPILKTINYDESLIKVNTLMFNPETLPKDLKKETIFEHIITLADEISDDNQILRNSVDLGIATMDMEQIYIETTEIVKRIPDIANRMDLIDALEKIKEGIEALGDASVDYNKNMISSNMYLTSELINRERNSCLFKRNNRK